MAQIIRPSEISEILLSQLKNIDDSLHWEETGYVLQVSDGVAVSTDLLHARPENCFVLRTE